MGYLVFDTLNTDTYTLIINMVICESYMFEFSASKDIE